MEKYILSDRASVHAFVKSPPSSSTRLVVDFKEMNEEKANKMERDLNRFHSACGCTLGQVFLGVTLALYGLYLYLHFENIDGVWSPTWKGLLLIIGSIFVGKLLGKAIAAFRLKRMIGELSLEMNIINE